MPSDVPPIVLARDPIVAWLERAMHRPLQARLLIVAFLLGAYLLTVAVVGPSLLVWLGASLPVGVAAFHFRLRGALSSWILTFLATDFAWWSHQPHRALAWDSDILLVFAFVLLSGALINALGRFIQHQRELLHALELVQFASAAITAVPQFRPLAEELLRRLAERLHVSFAALLLADGRTGILRAEITTSREPEWKSQFDGLQVRMSEVPPLAQVEQQRAPIMAQSSPADWWQRHQLTANSTSTLLAVPLMGENRVLGALILFDPGRAPVRGEVITMASTVANHLAVAIETAQRHEEARRQIVTDPLTRLFNRRFLDERLPLEWECARLSETALSLMILDLDHFKQVNDTYGHPTGDEILRQLARVIEQQTRTIDLRTRYGGEEFAIILPFTDSEAATSIAERLRQAVEQHPFRAGDLRLRLTVSVGIATTGPAIHNAEQLFQAADDALYTAKAWGRNRVCSAVSEAAGLAEA